MNKIFLATMVLALVCGVGLYYAATQGAITVQNLSQRRIDLLTVLFDGQMVHEQAYVKDGESFDLPFSLNQTRQIEIKTQLASGATSTGVVSPGWFANITAQIQRDGSIDFGDTKFATSSQADRSWGKATSGR